MGRELPFNNQLPWFLQQPVSLDPLWFWDLPGLPGGLQGVCVIRVPGSEPEGQGISSMSSLELQAEPGSSLKSQSSMEVCLSNGNSRADLRQAGLVDDRLEPGEPGVNNAAWRKGLGPSCTSESQLPHVQQELSLSSSPVFTKEALCPVPSTKSLCLSESPFYSSVKWIYMAWDF